jgi:hypothetical protein
MALMSKQTTLWGIGLIFWALTLIPQNLSARRANNGSWRQWEFSHFRLIFSDEHEALANRYAQALLRAELILHPLLPQPYQTITVVINDRTDLTNGFATALPYPLMMIFPVLPGPWESISESGHWEEELVLHEYAHILSLNARRSGARFLSYIFGTIISPNLLLPRWWHEGQAVEIETRFSNHGRLRSMQQDATLRGLYLPQNILPIDISESNETSIPSWPYGSRPYLYGSYMWSHMIAKYGEKTFLDLTWDHAGRIPYFINGSLEDRFAKTYSELFFEMRSELEEKIAQQLERLRALTPTAGVSLKLPFVENFAPDISPDGLKMAFIAKDEALRRSVRILRRKSVTTPFRAEDLQGGVTQKNPDGTVIQEVTIPRPRHGDDGPPGGSIQRVSWHPNSQSFVYDKISTVDRFLDSSDLWIYDLPTSKSRQLTFAARAREPAFSPNGQHIIFVKLAAGRSSLALFDVTSHAITEVWQGSFGENPSQPSFINEHQVAFILRKEGDNFLMKIDLRTKATQELAKGVNAFAKKGSDWILNSHRNGVPNIYIADEDLRKWQAQTHTETMISSFSDGKDGSIYASQLNDQGWQISAFKASSNLNLPQVPRLLADRYKTFALSSPTSLQEKKVEDYSSWPYLIPRYWLPSFFIDNTGLSGSITTSASDPLGLHSYSLFAAYLSENRRASYSFIYANNSTSAEISLLAAELNQTLLVGSEAATTKYYKAQALWELLFWAPEAKGGFGWNTQSRKLGDSRSDQAGPSMIVAYQDYALSGRQISPESGWGGTFSYTDYLSSGDQLSYKQVELSALKFFNSWLPTRHVLMAKVQGVYTDKSLPLANYTSTSSLPALANTHLPQYMVRGYQDAQFIGKTLGTLSFEYRFPLKDIYTGWGTQPLFVRRVHGAIVSDSLFVDGFAYNPEKNAYERPQSWTPISSLGAEAKLEMTLGYHIPLMIYSGFYIPLEKRWKTDEFRSALGLLFIN